MYFSPHLFPWVSFALPGVRDQVKRAEPCELSRQKHFDVALMQETHSDARN